MSYQRNITQRNKFLKKKIRPTLLLNQLPDRLLLLHAVNVLKNFQTQRVLIILERYFILKLDTCVTDTYRTIQHILGR